MSEFDRLSENGSDKDDDDDAMTPAEVLEKLEEVCS